MSEDLKSLLSTTSKYLDLLAQNWIHTPEDLLHYFPRTYEDRREIKQLDQLLLDGWVAQTVKGKITKKALITTGRGRKMTTIEFIDEHEKKGYIHALGTTYLIRTVTQGKRYYIIGKPAADKGKIIFWHPDIMPASETDEHAFNFWRIYPVYSDLSGIKWSWFAKKLFPIIGSLTAELKEYLPEKFLKEHNLPVLHTMMRDLHFPDTLQDAERARFRLFFERLLKIQLVSLINKETYQQDTSIKEEPDRELVKEFLATLPFELTHAQKRSLKECIDDLHSGKTMMRLLQWDVWSGKTVVAATVARYIIKKFGGQIALLAPIEVLAIQHYRTLAKFLLPLWIRIELLTGATKPPEKLRIKAWLAAGQINLVVGTHALLQENVTFDSLQFAIVDEQHKFGVRQRWFLQRHGAPHLLQMSATPIPRSLALAFFGEFDVSVIDEMPVGRKPITTKIISEAEFKKLKPWILTKIGQWQRVFIVTPLIEESEILNEVKSAQQQFEEISHIYTELKNEIGMLHGKMKSADKDTIMSEFKNGKIKLLVATTVIEVGIDIPEATIMVVMNSERFGLSQLHQLRWRVGRSDIQSYCFLETKKKSGDTYDRLKHMEDTTDGFKLAQIDMELRWTGEILGTRQSGDTDIPLSILSDTKFLQKIQDAAKRLLENEPNLVKERILRSELQDKMDELLV